MKKSQKNRTQTACGCGDPRASNLDAVQERLDALMKRVRELEPGGDLEGLIEEASAGLKRELYHAAARERTQTADEADFPPSAV
jgi:hypothetical protein